MKKILVTGDIGYEHLRKLEEANFEIVKPDKHLDEESLAETLTDMNGYLLGGDEIASAKALQNAKNLKIISFWGVGYSSFIDVDYCNANNIVIKNTPNTLTESVAEFTIGHTLNIFRRISAMNSEVKSGFSHKRETNTLSNSNIGIVGLGEIGLAIAKILVCGFKCNVHYFSRSRKKNAEKELGLKYVSLNQILKTCDAIIIMTSTNKDTIGIIGAKQLSLMQKNAFLINTARANLVEPKSLYEALTNNKIAGAAFDGYYQEPIPKPDEDKYGFLSLEDNKFIVTPHVAAYTKESRQKISKKAVNSLIKFFKIKDESINN